MDHLLNIIYASYSEHKPSPNPPHVVIITNKDKINLKTLANAAITTSDER